MIYGLYHSAAGMMVNEYRQNVVANNLANADSVGFKQDIAVFAERRPESIAGNRHGPSAEGLQELSGYLWLGRTDTDFSQGALVRTDEPLDLALDGPGFLVVEVDGKPRYTRDGRLMIDQQGQLRSVIDGAPLLSSSGTPIFLDPFGDRDTIGVDQDGRVLQDGMLRGQLARADFTDYRGLRKTGAGRFDAAGMTPVASPARVLSNHVESSGVVPVKELVTMIETSRAYQMNAGMLSLQDQSIARLINTIAR